MEVERERDDRMVNSGWRVMHEREREPQNTEVAR